MKMEIGGDNIFLMVLCAIIGGWFWLGIPLLIIFWFADPRWSKQEGWRFLR